MPINIILDQMRANLKKNGYHRSFAIETIRNGNKIIIGKATSI